MGAGYMIDFFLILILLNLKVKVEEDKTYIMKITPQSTLQEVRENIRENFNKGCKCHACGQLVKLYKIKFNSNMAILLSWQ